MISLGFFFLLAMLSLLLAAWVLPRAARAVGSSRGRFRDGLVVALILLLIGIVFGPINLAIAWKIAEPSWSIRPILAVAQLSVVFIVLKRWFALTTGRTFAPFGALLALAVMQIGLAFLVVRPYFVEAFVMPTSSMAPTLEPGDRFTVNKLIAPRRMDLVAHWRPGPDPAMYCKRLIGLPGERVRFDNGGVFVNDQPLALPAVLAGHCHASPAAARASISRYRDGETIALGPDEFFLIGDAVDISADSRLDGPSRASSLIGVVDALYWPPRKFHVFR